MKRRISLLSVVLFLGLIWTFPPAAQAGNMNVADAVFRDFSAGGCVETEVFIFAHSGVNDLKPEASVKITRYNYCAVDEDMEDLLDATGTVILSKNSLKTDSASHSASLSTTVTLHDSVSGKDIQFPLNVVWSGTSDLMKSNIDFFYQVPGAVFRTKDKFNSASRLAQASGSLSDGFTNYIPGVSEDAEISSLAVAKK